MKKQTKNDFKKRKGMSECAIKPIDTNIQEVIRIVDKDKVYYAQREVVDLIRNKCLAEVEKMIEDLIDHYEPYRPLTDSLKMEGAREGLSELKQKLKEDKK